MPYFFLTLLIFLLPFIINPFFGYFFEPPKVIFAQILIEVILAIVLFRNKSILKSLNKSQLILSATLLILTLFSLFFAKNSQVFFGNEIRLQGIFLLWHLLILSLLSSKLDINKLPKMLFPVCLIFLLVTAFLVEPDINGRAIGTLGEANALASSVIFFWPFAFIVNQRFKLGILLTALVIILVSGSHSGMLAFVFQIVFLIAARLVSLKKAVILVSLLLLLSLTLPFIKGGNWYENRSEIWYTAFLAGGQNFLGGGFGNIEQSLYQASAKLNNNLRFQAVDSSHNFLLDFWVQGGIVGIIVIILMILLSLKGLIKNLKVLEITSFLGLVCVLLFNPASVATLVAFWFILGQGYNYLYGKYR